MSKYTERDMSMAKEKLKMDSAQIAQIMGTVGSPLIVISELLKNAVDASAENIDIYYDFDSRSITVENDYKGFTFEEIQNLSRPGISAKKKGKNLTNERGMFLTGSKGLGLLSVFLLCDKAEIFTSPSDHSVHKITFDKKTGAIESLTLKQNSPKEYTKVILRDVSKEIISFLSSEAEVRKLRHICTSLYKGGDVPFPQMQLHIINEQVDSRHNINFTCDFPPMLYDVTFGYSKKTNVLRFCCNSPNKQITSDEITLTDPRGLLQLKSRLESELNSEIGSPVRIDILADVLELADEHWRGAVEGYLNTQKFYLLVEPTYYKSALLIFDRIKKEFGFASFGLVDIGKLRERETIRPRDDSLARKVDTDNKLARSYIDYLLGRVVCCEKAEQLRNFKTAITADGLLYQGYVVRSIRRELMDDAFIGRYAVSLRVSRLEEELTQIEDQLRYWNPIRQLLSQSKEPLFTHFFVQNTVAEKQKAYLHGMEITKEVTDIEDQLSKLDLLWLDEQRRTIAALGDEIIALNKEKEQKGIQIGQRKERIRQLDYEVLPDHYQQLSNMEDRLQDDFPAEYQENIGLPRYQQELDRLKRADIVHKNFSSRLEQSVKEQDTARKKLFIARREYTDRFKPCSFRVEAMDNDEFESERRLLEESELPKYREKINAARESAMEQFQNDFLAKLKSSIDQVQDQVKNLNRALRQAQFGTDSYQFRVERNPDYAEYYDMIMDPELMEGDVGLFARPFQDKYGQLIEKLFSQITTADDTQLNARKQSELQENIQRYTDFRTYLKFDLETTDQNGTKQLLSQTLNTKSGGETQTPFYIAVLASFAQLYRVNDTSSFGNTVRLAVFDEAFNKMDSDRIIESVRLLRRMGLQAIICTPPDKVSDIMPIADRTLLVNKDKYIMHILPFGKEIAQ